LGLRTGGSVSATFCLQISAAVELAGPGFRPQDRVSGSVPAGWGLNAMRLVVFSSSMVVFAALIGACRGELVCTEEIRVAVRVHISSPDYLPVDRVTAERSRESDCDASSIESDASTDETYRCNEQGGGEYTIRVYSGDQVWTNEAYVRANECHTTEIADVDILMDSATAQAD